MKNMKNFFFALVFIFLAFLAWQYYSQSSFDFKINNLEKINIKGLKDLNIFSNEEKDLDDRLDDKYQDLKISEDLIVPKEILVCLLGAKENLKKAQTESYQKSENLLNEALLDFNKCQQDFTDIESCYQDYVLRQDKIIETIKLERVNINNAYQFNLQLCWPDVSEKDLELIFNKI